MRHAIGQVYSITIRPFGGVNARWPDILATLSTRFEKDEFLFSVEKDGTAGSHVQGYLRVSKEVRQDNLRALIKRLYPPSPQDNPRSYLEVRTHNNPKILIGYCLKESQVYETNIDSHRLDEARKFYSTFTKKPKRKLKELPAMSKIIQWMTDKVEELGCDPSDLSPTQCMRQMIWDNLLTPEESAKVKMEVLSMHWEVKSMTKPPGVHASEVLIFENDLNSMKQELREQDFHEHPEDYF